MTKKLFIEVDAASMGGEWTGEASDLEEFCKVFQTVLDRECDEKIEVIAITDSVNGAGNRHPEIEDGDWPVTYIMWNAAFDAHYDKNPSAWGE